jgi:hypothetical protein
VRAGRTDADDAVRDVGADGRAVEGFAGAGAGFVAAGVFFAASVTGARGRGAAGASPSPAIDFAETEAASDGRAAEGAAAAPALGGTMDARRLGAGAVGLVDVDAFSAGLLAATAAGGFAGAALTLVVFFRAAVAPAVGTLDAVEAGVGAALVDFVTVGGDAFTEPAPNVPELSI